MEDQNELNESKKLNDDNLLDDDTFDEIANQTPILLTNNSEAYEDFTKRSTNK